MDYIDILMYICAITYVFFMLHIDNHFLKEYHTRDMYGNIYIDGNISLMETLKEKIGYSGNPLYWL